MANSLAQILEIKDLIDSKQFSSAKMKLKNLKSNLELKKLFEFHEIITKLNISIIIRVYERKSSLPDRFKLVSNCLKIF